MNELKKKLCIVFAGGGTGGHIYPGIAVADQLKRSAAEKNIEVDIHWIGFSKGMDRSIVEKNLVSEGGSIAEFHGIPSGKLRRNFSLRNFTDLFRIAMGFFASVSVLKKIKPDFLFSKGGFVSVPPCWAASFLKIPYFTHECDFTPGLATKLNSSRAKRILLSYEATKNFMPSLAGKCIVTGNPVRPVFYEDHSAEGRKFLGIPEDCKKPVLLVLGGSLGAKQINDLVIENLESLKKDFIVVHQTGKKFAEENPQVMKSGDSDYKPYEFIHGEMPWVIQAADAVISRAGANSLWECAATSKPMILVPLCGAGTRGDQVDNARFFEKEGAALVLAGKEATSENLLAAVEKLKSGEFRRNLSQACGSICSRLFAAGTPAEKISQLILEDHNGTN